MEGEKLCIELSLLALTNLTQDEAGVIAFLNINESNKRG